MKIQHWNSSAWIIDSVHGRIQTYDRAWRVAPSSNEADTLPIKLPAALHNWSGYQDPKPFPL